MCFYDLNTKYESLKCVCVWCVGREADGTKGWRSGRVVRNSVRENIEKMKTTGFGERMKI